jgi:hypothetical protein
MAKFVGDNPDVKGRYEGHDDEGGAPFPPVKLGSVQQVGTGCALNSNPISPNMKKGNSPSGGEAGGVNL